MIRKLLHLVPTGYVVHRVAHTWMVFDRAAAPHLVPLRLADPAVREKLFEHAPVRGRGAAPTVKIHPGLTAVLRRYRHGGLLGRLTGSLYWGPDRALEELRVTARAEAAGAPVPHVLCLAVWPVGGPFWSALIGTREEPGAQDLLGALSHTAEPRARRDLLRRVGASLRKLHDEGVDHRDLQLRNILVVPGEPEPRIVVVDLDRAVFHSRGALPVGHRAENLGRLNRSGVKNGLWSRTPCARDAAAFLSGYTKGSRKLRAELASYVPRERAKLAIRRLRYRLIGTRNQA